MPSSYLAGVVEAEVGFSGYIWPGGVRVCGYLNCGSCCIEIPWKEGLGCVFLREGF